MKVTEPRSFRDLDCFVGYEVAFKQLMRAWFHRSD